MDRRSFLGVLAAIPAAGCAGDGGYEAAQARARAPLPAEPGFADLVRFATLAANGHNTQPWLFAEKGKAALIRPDFARRTPVVDPDDHHLFASLGCAAENLAIAARASGLSGEVETDPAGIASVTIAAGSRREAELAQAIPLRQCVRADYSGAKADGASVARMVAAASVAGVETVIVDDAAGMERIGEVVVDGNSRQMDNPAFVEELEHWIRFNRAQAAATGDGLLAEASGNPSLPSFLGPLAFSLFFSKGSENEKYARHIRTSSGIAVIVAPSDDPAGWMAGGRACQRFLLQATVEGLACAFVNQAVEEKASRALLQAALGLGSRRPNLVIRYGAAPRLAWSPRRPPQAVIVPA